MVPTRINEGYTHTNTELHTLCGIYVDFIKSTFATDNLSAYVDAYHDGDTEFMRFSIWSDKDPEEQLSVWLEATGKYCYSTPKDHANAFAFEQVIGVNDMVEAFHFCAMLFAATNAKIVDFGMVGNEANPEVSVPKENDPSHPFGKINLWTNQSPV
jgi:hypothetical protein